jgi:hypothetical protein
MGFSGLTELLLISPLYRHPRANPSFPPLTKGGIIPLFGKGARGDFLKHISSFIMESLVRIQ